MKTIFPGETIYLPFNTVDSTGAPITLAGSPTIAVYRDEADTQFTTGATLTVDKLSTNDAQTGAHFVACVTADQSVYIPGHDYKVVLTAGTVGGVSKVGLVVGSFRIANLSYLGILDSGVAAAVAAGTLTLRSGHGLTANHMPCTLHVFNATTGSKSKQTRTGLSISGDVVALDQNWTTTPDGAGTVLTYVAFAQAPALPHAAAYGTLTDAQLLEKILALVGGPSDGAGSTVETFYAPDGLTAEVAVTNDGSDRTAMDLNP